jgi:uncharacterized protein
MFKRLMWIVIGTLSCALGLLGVILPGLPTTPFLLLTVFAYSKGSKRFHTWFIQSKLYTKHLESFHKHKCMSKKQKDLLMLYSDLVVLISFMTINNIMLRLVLIILVVTKYWYFHRFITIIKSQPDHDIRHTLKSHGVLKKIKWSQ